MPASTRSCCAGPSAASPDHTVHASCPAAAVRYRGSRPSRRRAAHAHRSGRPPSAVRPDYPAPRPGHHQRNQPRPRPSRRPGQTAPAPGPLSRRPPARLGSRHCLADRPARHPTDRPARSPPHRPPHDAPPAATGPHRYPPDPGLPPPSPPRRSAPGPADGRLLRHRRHRGCPPPLLRHAYRRTPAPRRARRAGQPVAHPAHTGTPRLLRQPPPLRRPVRATADRLAAPPTARASHRPHRPASRPPAARSDRTSSPRPRPSPPRCSPAPPSSNSPPPAPATTTLPRPRSPCTTAPATPTAAPPTPCRPGQASSCGLRPASPGSSPARTRSCSPRQVTAGTYCAWQRRPDCARPSRQQPAAKARSDVWSGTGASGRKPRGTKRYRPGAPGRRDADHPAVLARWARLSRSRSRRTRRR
ncbi:hypothetical protein RKD37_000267 [Streptomyces ambofaciens]